MTAVPVPVAIPVAVATGVGREGRGSTVAAPDAPAGDLVPARRCALMTPILPSLIVRCVLTVDSAEPAELAAFWCALLGTTVAGTMDQYVFLTPAAGQPGLTFQQVADRSPGKNALHLDLHVGTPEAVEATVAEAVSLGASIHERVEQGGIFWVVLTDPEGNRFCVVAAD